MGSRSSADREVSVELRMSKATADNLAHAGCSSLETPNSRPADVPTDDVGSAVLAILSSVAAISRVKERVASFDQREVMDLVDNEVDAVRAGRP